MVGSSTVGGDQVRTKVVCLMLNSFSIAILSIAIAESAIAGNLIKTAIGSVAWLGFIALAGKYYNEIMDAFEGGRK